ncbi:unnamed protein product [Rhodiola kirilowii]
MSMMAQMMESNKESTRRMEAKMDEIMAENKRLAKENTQLKQIGKLPSQPDVNSIEHVEAITLKSGKVLPTPQGKSSLDGKEVEGGVAKENLEVETLKLLRRGKKRKKSRF